MALYEVSELHLGGNAPSRSGYIVLGANVRYTVNTEEIVPLPVKCDYCRTVSVKNETNCKSCGGPLPIPEVVEHIVQRDFIISRNMLDCTTMADTSTTYIVGIARENMIETSVRRERVR